MIKSLGKCKHDLQTPLYKNRYLRLALIQFCKKSPVNFRKFLLVPPGFNPKAGALFLLGNLNMYKATNEDKYKIEAQKLFSMLKETLIKTCLLSANFTIEPCRDRHLILKTGPFPGKR